MPNAFRDKWLNSQVTDRVAIFLIMSFAEMSFAVLESKDRVLLDPTFDSLGQKCAHQAKKSQRILLLKHKHRRHVF